MSEVSRPRRTLVADAPDFPQEAVVGQLAYDFAKNSEGLIDTIVVNEKTLERYREKLGELIGLMKAGKFWPLAHANDSWGWPKGNVSLQSAARFEKTISLPEDEDDDERSDAGQEVAP